MKLKTALPVALLIIATCLRVAQAGGISYRTTLIDAATNRWSYTYDLADYRLYTTVNFMTGEVLDFVFNTNLYADLALLPEGPGADWSAMVIQPDPSLPAFGYYDLQAQVDNPSTTGPFTVAFTWLGDGAPGRQAFQVYGADYSFYTGSVTEAVPEPGSLSLLLAGIVVALARVAAARGKGRGFRAGLWAWLLIGAASSAQAAVTITRLDLIRTVRVSRTLFDYSYQVSVINSGEAVKNVVATVTSSSVATVVVDGTVNIGSLAAGEGTTSNDTFTIRQDRLKPFDPSSLQWQISSDLANHAPVAAASVDFANTTVGQVINLDGRSSSDSDADPLTFAWGVLNAPTGSTTALTSPQSAQAGLRIDRAGTYRIQLAVNDGKVSSLPVTLSVYATMPSHSLPWLFLPAGAGSEADSQAYYANQPFSLDCNSWAADALSGSPVGVVWGCRVDPSGAPLDTVQWHNVTGEDVFIDAPIAATFYDDNSLAIGRRVMCRDTDSRAGAGIACIVSNHGPVSGSAGFPNSDAALSDAVAARNPSSFSALWASTQPDAPLSLNLQASSRCAPSSESPNYILRPGDQVSIGPATGSIWAGNILFGNNGPDGIGGYACSRTIFDNQDCPLTGAPLYGLVVSPLSELTADGNAGTTQAHFVGSANRTFTVAAHGRLELCVNSPTSRGDMALLGAKGSFSVPVSVQRANRVSFQTYAFNGTLLSATHIDGEGSKQVPQACMSCHGGRWNASTHSVNGASMLPFVLADLKFSTQAGYTRADQEAALLALNRMVLKSRPNPDDPNDPIAVWIKGTYANFTRSTADDSFVPPGWGNDAVLYRKVVRPYCMSCHQAQRSSVNFNTAAQFRGLSNSIRNQVCNSHRMPHGEAAFVAFRQSDALQVLKKELFGGAECAP